MVIKLLALQSIGLLHVICSQIQRNINNFFKLIGRMLDYEPSSRIVLSEALRHVYFDRLDPKLKELVDGIKNNNNQGINYTKDFN
ncbi:Protein kinase domain-containing protein [Meloidogyne graminicola]|uniref:Protein kinase domain-containing protein n=1 Tax=Meloidogyne graminicola TaxID=189291 RepID=A0A8S9ZDP5_9BILA|nr:Protein kinase domain-containing protein [Meloidogyne graminicola]